MNIRAIVGLALGVVAAATIGACSSSEACLASADCARGLACLDNAVCGVYTCTSSADCVNDGEFVEVCYFGDDDGNYDPTGDGVCSHSECRSDRDCDGGVCVDGACYESAVDVGCTSRDDCPTGQACIAEECTAPGTVCLSTDECAAPLVCDNGTCIEEVVVECDPACVAGERCDNGTCVPDVVTGCDPACGEGETCVDEVCMVDSTGGMLCDGCAANTDCGADADVCVYLNGQDPFCGVVCETAAECPSGFSCLTVDSQGNRQCVPAGGACTGCLVDGCADGQFCNAGTGACDATLASCEACGSDDQCSTGNCQLYGGQQFCLSPCDVGCDTGYACGDVNGEQLCAPDEGACGGVSCELTADDCPDGSAVLDTVNCRCVSCLASSDCETGETCTSTGRCLAGTGDCATTSDCPGGYCQGGVCVACLTASDCSGGETCIRGACQGCDCPDGFRCNPSTGGCDEIIGGGDCSSDSDCQLEAIGLGGDGTNATCDASLGCYTLGACGATDPFGAPCPSGLACVAVLDIFGGSTGEACTGCTVGNDATCRQGETCTEPLIDIFMTGAYCSSGGGLGF